MNEQELIESGKLELYMAGALCGQEARTIAFQISNSAILQQKVRDIESAMLAGLSEGQFDPGVELKAKILNEIEKQNNLSVSIPSESHSHSISHSIVKFRTSFALSAAAAILLLITLGIGLYKQNQKIKEQNGLIAKLNLQYDQKLTTLSGDSAELAKLADQLALINHHFTKKIVLSGGADEPDSRAIVYWNTFNKRVIVNPNTLPKPPAGKEYQVWAESEGKFMNAGVLEISEDTIKLMEVKNVPVAHAFMITLETRGGVNEPNLSATLVKGTI